MCCYNRPIIKTAIWPIEFCHFRRSWMTLNDIYLQQDFSNVTPQTFGEYLQQGSPGSLCDSTDSCFKIVFHCLVFIIWTTNKLYCSLLHTENGCHLQNNKQLLTFTVVNRQDIRLWQTSHDCILTFSEHGIAWHMTLHYEINCPQLRVEVRLTALPSFLTVT